MGSTVSIGVAPPRRKGEGGDRGKAGGDGAQQIDDAEGEFLAGEPAGAADQIEAEGNGRWRSARVATAPARGSTDAGSGVASRAARARAPPISRPCWHYRGDRFGPAI